jgi:TRAP-type transport system periplasmic protein
MRKTIVGGLAVAVLMCGIARAQELQYAIAFNQNDGFAKLAAKWAEGVKSISGGKIDIKLALNGALVPLPQTLDAVSDGVVPIGMGAASFTSGTIPALGYVEMVGGLPLEKPTTGEALANIWGDMQALFAKRGVRLLWGAPAFSTGLVCRNGFVKNPEDWKGKKIRTAGRWQSKQVAAMGGTPLPMPPSELYVALQNGVTDCALMTPSIVTSARLYEVAPYYSDFDLPSNVTFTIINADVWNKFSEDQRGAITKLSDKTTQDAAVSMRELATTDLKSLGEKGKVYTLTPRERTALVNVSKPIFKEVAAAAGEGAGKAMTDKLAAYQ